MADAGEFPKNDFDVFYAEDNNILVKGEPPIGSIVAWLKNFDGTPNIPENWIECNGQVIDDPDSPYYGMTAPNLNNENRFLRGNTTSGGTGGAETHEHNLQQDCFCQGEVTSIKHLNPTNHLPPYYNVVWIMRIK